MLPYQNPLFLSLLPCLFLSPPVHALQRCDSVHGVSQGPVRGVPGLHSVQMVLTRQILRYRRLSGVHVLPWWFRAAVLWPDDVQLVQCGKVFRGQRVDRLRLLQSRLLQCEDRPAGLRAVSSGHLPERHGCHGLLQMPHRVLRTLDRSAVRNAVSRWNLHQRGSCDDVHSVRPGLRGQRQLRRHDLLAVPCGGQYLRSYDWGGVVH